MSPNEDDAGLRDGQHRLRVPTSLAKLKLLAMDALESNPQWRPGQAAFNVVHEHHPAIANAIRGTETDPFHVTSRLPAFWEQVEESLT